MLLLLVKIICPGLESGLREVFEIQWRPSILHRVRSSSINEYHNECLVGGVWFPHTEYKYLRLTVIIAVVERRREML